MTAVIPHGRDATLLRLAADLLAHNQLLVDAARRALAEVAVGTSDEAIEAAVEYDADLVALLGLEGAWRAYQDLEVELGAKTLRARGMRYESITRWLSKHPQAWRSMLVEAFARAGVRSAYATPEEARLAVPELGADLERARRVMATMRRGSVRV